MKFLFKKMEPKFVIPAKKQMINGMMVEVTPSKRIEVKNGVLETSEYVKSHPDFTEEEIIERLRGDIKFNTEEIREISAADERAMKIRAKKLREAEEEIKALKAEDKK